MKQLIDWKPNYSIKSGILKSYEIMEKWSKDFDWNEQINEKKLLIIHPFYSLEAMVFLDDMFIIV